MSTRSAEARSYFADKLELVRRRVDPLGDGPIHRAFFDTLFPVIEERLTEELTGWSTWPPLFILASDNRGEHLGALDAALQSVIDHSSSDPSDSIHRWLATSALDSRLWRGGLFELAMKTKFLAGADDVEFDSPLPNGRDVDIRARVAGRQVCLDATVITESDEDQDVWERFMAAQEAEGRAVLIRPGVHDHADSNGPSPYYDCVRTYLKIFDKLAKRWDPARSQMSSEDPNVLLLSVWTGYGMPYTSSPGIGWAVDELFAARPVPPPSPSPNRPGITDVSLPAFLREVAPGAADALLQSPRLLSGLMLFAEGTLNSTRLNSFANPPNQLDNSAMSALESIASIPLAWA